MGNVVNICPVCGFPMKYLPADYNICPSCGTEFGYEDAGRSHADLRAEWIQGGARWWSPVDPQPANWNVDRRLENVAGIERQKI